MTNKEAVTIVERIRYYMEGGECWTPTEFEAMDMAIESLNRQDIHDINVSDMIYRQMAIDALMDEFKRIPTMAIRAKHVIGQLPSAQFIEPERKTGTWQRKYSRPGVYADLCWHCSICGGKFSDTYANMWKYCPDCGAKMEGEQ